MGEIDIFSDALGTNRGLNNPTLQNIKSATEKDIAMLILSTESKN
jgi:hypothetical protein